MPVLILYSLKLAPPCSGGKVYKSCATACPKTCENYEREVECDIDSVDGCFCPGNLVEKDGVCVNPIKCRQYFLITHSLPVKLL